MRMRFVPRDGRPFTDAAAAALAPVSGVLARLLWARGVQNAAQAEVFLHPDESALHDPLLLSGVPEAVALLSRAREERVRAVVYGDYDVDGLCATALMVEALRRYGLEADAFTPSREAGYGLHTEDMAALAEHHGLLLTVDLGVTNAAEVRAAQALGLRVIVTDHHQPGLEPCPADALVSPLLGAYPCPKLCGTGVAFKLAQALLGLEAAREWLGLAALATVADVVPLLDENRALVALGLPCVADRPGLKALLDVSGASGEIDSDTLGFQLGPRINAAGRMGVSGPALELLLARDPARAAVLARELDATNAQRKQTERAIAAEAEKQAADFDFVGRRLLVVRGEGWHAGVIGLVAGRLCQRYYRPVLALTEQDGRLHGSLRSIPGVNIHRCLQACDELLERYGGHEQAAGVTLAAKNAPAFLERLEQAVAASAPAACFAPAQPYDADIALSGITDALVERLQALRPFGMGNPAPLFVARGLRVERKRACGASGAHLQLAFRQGGAVLDGIAFGMGADAASMPPLVDACFAAQVNEYMGRKRLQCDVRAWTPAAGAAKAQLDQFSEEDFRLALLDALEACAGVPAGDADTPDGEHDALAATESKAAVPASAGEDMPSASGGANEALTLTSAENGTRAADASVKNGAAHGATATALTATANPAAEPTAFVKDIAFAPAKEAHTPTNTENVAALASARAEDGAPTAPASTEIGALTADLSANEVPAPASSGASEPPAPTGTPSVHSAPAAVALPKAGKPAPDAELYSDIGAPSTAPDGLGATAPSAMPNGQDAPSAPGTRAEAGPAMSAISAGLSGAPSVTPSSSPSGTASAPRPLPPDPYAPLPPALLARVDAWLQAPEGTLLVARTQDTAEWAIARWGEALTLCVGAPTDARCPTSLAVLPAPQAVPPRYRRVALLDGAIGPGELALWRARLPRAEIIAPPGPSQALCALAARADAGDEAYRKLYKVLRGGDARSLHELARVAGLTPVQTHAGLTAFAQLGLLAYRRLPFSAALLPPARCALDDSPLLAALRALAQLREEEMDC